MRYTSILLYYIVLYHWHLSNNVLIKNSQASTALVNLCVSLNCSELVEFIIFVMVMIGAVRHGIIFIFLYSFHQQAEQALKIIFFARETSTIYC